MTTLEYMRKMYAHYIGQMTWWRDTAQKETNCTKEYRQMMEEQAMEKAAHYAEAVKALELAEKAGEMVSG